MQEILHERPDSAEAACFRRIRRRICAAASEEGAGGRETEIEMPSGRAGMPAMQADQERNAFHIPSARRYEDIVLLAATICETPVAFIAIFDAERTGIKATFGFDRSAMPDSGTFRRLAVETPDEVLVVPDTKADHRFAHGFFRMHGEELQFYAGAALCGEGGHAAGALCVMDRMPRLLSEAQRHALCALGRQAAYLLESESRLAALRESELRFKAFMDNSPALAWLKDQEGRYLYVNRPFQQRCGLPPSAILGKTDFEIWPGHTAQQVYRRESELLADGAVVNELEAYDMADGGQSYWQVSRFLLGGPHRLMGGLGLEVTESKRYEQKLMQYQQELQHALQRMEVLSVTDGLTGLYNRRAFDDKLAEEFERARRYRLPLSLLLIDVDNFKQFNDAMGHTEGDELLCSVAAMLKENARANDITARYGGDEFAVILPNTDSKVALHLAERLRSNARGLCLRPFQTTLSIGVAALLPHMQAGRELIVSADTALYSAKRCGRNRVAGAA